jgi:hypothetical protein
MEMDRRLSGMSGVKNDNLLLKSQKIENNGRIYTICVRLITF